MKFTNISSQQINFGSTFKPDLTPQNIKSNSIVESVQKWHIFKDTLVNFGLAELDADSGGIKMLDNQIDFVPKAVANSLGIKLNRII